MTTDYLTFVSGYAGNRWKEISLNLQSDWIGHVAYRLWQITSM